MFENIVARIIKFAMEHGCFLSVQTGVTRGFYFMNAFEATETLLSLRDVTFRVDIHNSFSESRIASVLVEGGSFIVRDSEIMDTLTAYLNEM